MKRQHPDINKNYDNDENQSCPPSLQEDITRSLNEQEHRVTKSQQCLPQYNDSITHTHEKQQRQTKNQGFKRQGIQEKHGPQSKIEVNIINKKGTDFDCQKVQSVELSCEEQSYRSESFKSRQNRHSQQEIQEPRSGKKFRKEKPEQMKRNEPERREDLKEEILNVLIAGAQDTGKSTFIRCFKRKQRRIGEPFIKSRTKEIRYEIGMGDQNLLNKRNSVYFVDVPGFAANQEDKYLRQIEQYARAQWRIYEQRPDQDRRIHCCLYFLRGPRIKQSDINVMKKLSFLFNLIPVISKSDQYTKDEIRETKEEFHRKIATAGQIHLYDIEEYYLFKLGTGRINEAINSKFGKFPPFVIASSFQKESPQSGTFVRKYPWGRVQIQNLQHTDFQRLCEFLLGDVRTQFINKLISLSALEVVEIVEEEIGIIGNQICLQNSRIEKDGRKNKLIVGSLLVMIGITGFYFSKKDWLHNIFSKKISKS